MIIGQYDAVITQKGRLAIPSRFRKELGRTIVLAKWLDGCLVGISMKDFETILRNLLGKREIATTSVREIERFVLGSAFELKLDSQGRFVLPKVLRDYASLKTRVVFVGLGDRFEIWDEEKWLKKEKELQKEPAQMMERMAQERLKV